MKTTIMMALGLALAPLATFGNNTATLLQWQKADAPVVLVEEVIDPDFRIGQKLAVRVLAETDSMIQPGTLLLLDAEGISPATQGPARRWLVNLKEVQNLRALHPRNEMLHAKAPAAAIATTDGLKNFTWSQEASWSGITRYVKQHISEEEVRRLPIICRETWKPHSRRYEADGKWYEDFALECSMALPAAWCKGYLPGERILLHWPVAEVGGPAPTPAAQKEHEARARGSFGVFLLTDQFQREGNTLHLNREHCRIIPGNNGNTDKIAALLAPENAPVVPLQWSEYSPYMPDAAAARTVTDLERACHFVYKGAERWDSVLRCRYISTQLIDFDDKRLAKLYKREYNVLEVQECLKGEWKPGIRLSFWRKVEGDKRPAGIYPAEGEIFLGFAKADTIWSPAENITHLGQDDFQFMRMKATPLQAEAMQKVMRDYPELFGKAKPQEKPRQIDTEEARRIAMNALQQQGLLTQAAYNVNGLGDYLLVFPADRKGAHVLLHNDGRIARIFTPEQI